MRDIHCPLFYPLLLPSPLTPSPCLSFSLFSHSPTSPPPLSFLLLTSLLLSSSSHSSSPSPPSSPLLSSITLSQLFTHPFLLTHISTLLPSFSLPLLLLRVAELQHKKEDCSVIMIQRVYRGFANRKKFREFITERKTYYTIRLLENEIRDTFLYGFLEFFGFAPILVSDTPCERIYKQYPKYAHAVISGKNRPNLVVYLRLKKSNFLLGRSSRLRIYFFIHFLFLFLFYFLTIYPFI